MMNYQELVNKCKQAYKENDLTSAYEFWKKIYNVLDEKLSQFDINNDNERYKCYEEFNKYISQFDNQEVYDITDYGKQKAYKQLEVEKTYNMLDKSFKCSDLVKSNKKMKYLDDFANFYEWCILKSEDEDYKYNIYDLQTNEIIDCLEDKNKTLNETILRIVDKALDYELNEREYETDEEYNKFIKTRYIKGLMSIQEEYLEKCKKELDKEIEYQEKRLDNCAYGKSDLYYLEHLKYKRDFLERWY